MAREVGMIGWMGVSSVGGRTRRLAGAIGALSLAMVVPCAAGAQSPRGSPDPDSTVRALEPLIGRWRIPPGDSLLARNPELERLVVIEAQWLVGGKAIRYREHVWPDSTRGGELEGLIYWDPAEERLELIAVAGHGPGQGRLFVGELKPLADGRIEKVYDVFYRTLADTPGEELGGRRRRYREIIEVAGPDRLTHTLEWWRDGRWQPFGRGRYELVRADADRR
jgi:hypothetical protein